MKKLFPHLLPLLAAAILATLAACNKNKTTITVEEYGTGIPIENARVSLIDCESEPLGSTDCFEVASGTTDKNGKFKTKKAAFAAGATAERYWPTGDDQIIIDAISGISKIPNLIYLYPEAWLEVTVRNETGAYQITVPSETVNGSNRQIMLGQGEEEKLQIFRKGNIPHSYIFSIQDTPGEFRLDYSNVFVKKENGESIQVNQTPANWFDIFLKGHETTRISITY